MKINEEIIKELVRSRIKNSDDLARLKRKMAKIYKSGCPDNISLLKTYHELVEKKKIKKLPIAENMLKTRPVRSLSGIVNISVLTKPYPCPGKCIYCPIEKNIPKSYVSGEPAVERAKRLKYNPYLQVKKRIEMLEMEGHSADKVELRTVGGTWSYYPKKYQKWFIKRCFDACNQKNAENIEEAQRLNERAKYRIIGLSVETRPDFINEKEIKWLRELGATMVELGVQSIYDDVLKLNKRGHTIKETISATKLLKDAGFKILYQMMPNLFGSDLKRDEKVFKELFKNQDFQPDLLKIYPCALLKSAPLYRQYKNKKYRPYSEKQLIKLIKAIKKNIPYYTRIQRITRDIPGNQIIAGPAKISNLRQILANNMRREDWYCKCIRCREVKDSYDPKEKLYLFRQDYFASDGKEIFLSYENKNRTKLYSLLRIRIPSKDYILPILKNSAIIRELHTFGSLQPIEKRGDRVSSNSAQHRGLGKKLIKKAEKIAFREFKTRNIAVISGIGAREYYKKLGYKLNNGYMVKTSNL